MCRRGLFAVGHGLEYCEEEERLLLVSGTGILCGRPPLCRREGGMRRFLQEQPVHGHDVCGFRISSAQHLLREGWALPRWERWRPREAGSHGGAGPARRSLPLRAGWGGGRRQRSRRSRDLEHVAHGPGGRVDRRPMPRGMGPGRGGPCGRKNRGVCLARNGGAPARLVGEPRVHGGGPEVAVAGPVLHRLPPQLPCWQLLGGQESSAREASPQFPCGASFRSRVGVVFVSEKVGVRLALRDGKRSGGPRRRTSPRRDSDAR
mmetsp:Transcript_46134/g.119715  ORF Transcript_46134/g.119715 Transcript_46134/m.119715 type:complete len:262 (-) Transcript_46134:239-1024(-)